MYINLMDPAVAAAHRSGDFTLASGNDGADTLIGGAGRNGLFGGGGDDTIVGGPGDDELAGEGIAFPAIWPPPPIPEVYFGRDLIFGGAGTDQISGDWGSDTLFGEAGADTLSGGEGDDALFGGAGADMLEGGIGRDVLYGGSGSDTIDGGTGRNLLVGGAGKDVFRLSSPSDAEPDGLDDTVQFILDFRQGQDLIDLGRLNSYAGWWGDLQDEAFVFRGEEALIDYDEASPEFGPAMPGQLRYELRGNTTVVQLDAAKGHVYMAHSVIGRADGVVDTEITLLGRHHLTAADFLL
jgi:Ca2+-binding RTX toxin-like protein